VARRKKYITESSIGFQPPGFMTLSLLKIISVSEAFVGLKAY
jgi:hypothetical protein